MKILITGHRGFIGSALWEAFEKKHELCGFDVILGDDILDRYKLEYLFETNHFDCIIHLAALTGARRGELFAVRYLQTNIIGTKNLIDLSEKYGVKKFIHFSSSSILKPTTIYGMSKLCGEKLIERSNIQTRFIIRPFTVIGLNGRADQVISKWLEFLRNGKPIPIHGFSTKRNFTYINDIIKFVKLLIADNDKWGCAIYELCNPKQISLGELFDIFEEYFGEMQFEDCGLDRFELPENVGQWNAPFEATSVIPIIKKILKKEGHV